MSSLKTAQRVTIIADALLEEIIIGELGKLGARGFSIMDCRGSGEHEIVQDLATIPSRIRIETIVQPAVAEAIMTFLESPHLAQRALTGCVDTVQVSALDRF